MVSSSAGAHTKTGSIIFFRFFSFYPSPLTMLGYPLFRWGLFFAPKLLRFTLSQSFKFLKIAQNFRVSTSGITTLPEVQNFYASLNKNFRNFGYPREHRLQLRCYSPLTTPFPATVRCARERESSTTFRTSLNFWAENALSLCVSQRSTTTELPGVMAWCSARWWICFCFLTANPTNASEQLNNPQLVTRRFGAGSSSGQRVTERVLRRM